HRLDLLQFQQTEINESDLKENEDIHLEEQRLELQNYATIFEAFASSYEALYGERKALEYVDMAKRAFEDPKLIDTPYEKFAKKIANAYYQLEEITFDIRNEQEALYFDEGKLNEIENRLNLIGQLKRKYGETVNDIIDYHKKISVEIDEIENREAYHEQLLQQLEVAKQSAIKAAEKLSDARKTAANALVA